MRAFFSSLLAALLLAFPAAGDVAGSDWMGHLDGNLRLSQLTIPGTHNAGARFETFSGTAACQRHTLAEQLNFGVRLLDIRCRHTNNAFAIHHGSAAQKMVFDDVLNQVCGFLGSHPSECVMMSIKEEYKASDNTRSFNATFDSYVAARSNSWWLGSTVPTLKTVRGKIVLLRRFGRAGDLGLDASHWPDNTNFNAAQLSVQDCYQVPENATKWTHITNALSAALAGANPEVLHLNFISGYRPGLFGIPSIPAVANDMNSRLEAYFQTPRPGHYGWLLLDFAEPAGVQLLYRVNPLAP